MDENEKTTIMELLKLSKWTILAMLVVGGFVGNEMLF